MFEFTREFILNDITNVRMGGKTRGIACTKND